MSLSIGLCFHRDEPAASVVPRARAAEDDGYDEFWVIEDCFFTAGVSLATAALVATGHIGVGVGIMPAVARNPAITAMEIATIAELAPGRFHAGIGHGVQAWMAQMGAAVDSPLTMLDETITVVRRLLAGEVVTVDGRYVSMDDVSLAPAPECAPLVSAGVRGPRSLEVSGRVADGTILADFSGPSYVRWARERIADGGGTARDHRVTVFASMAVAPDGDAMRMVMAPELAAVCSTAPTSLTRAPFWGELAETAAKIGWLAAIQAMPTTWWNEIAPVGTPDDAHQYLANMEAAGVDCVAVFPSPVTPIEDASWFARSVLQPARC